MTFRVTYEFVCDLCGKNIGSENYKLFNDPNFEIPRPSRLYGQHMYLGGSHLDLCQDCKTPIEKAFKKRIEELRNEDRLVGITP